MTFYANSIYITGEVPWVASGTFIKIEDEIRK
jgi:hypothetical protein